MPDQASLISWQQLETEAPPIALLAKQRFELTRIALLGTLRSNGSPRVSPVEPYLRRAAALRCDVLVAEDARPAS
jgi:hypothetical protein